MTRVTARCVDCERVRERCLPAVKRVDGTIDYVCPQCWRELEYDAFLYEHKPRGVVHDAP